MSFNKLLNNNKHAVVLLIMLVALQGCGKADISSNCSTNGFGRVECSFHNKGNAEGSLCVKVKLLPTSENSFAKSAYSQYVNGISSQEICSGIVKANDVVQRSQHGGFEVAPSDFCSLVRGGSWSDGCYLLIHNQSNESLAHEKEDSTSTKKLESSKPEDVAMTPTQHVEKNGEEVYKAVCSQCHEAGLLNAPKLGDKDAWKARNAKGLDTLVEHVIKGFNSMPPKGGNPQLSDNEVKDAVKYMANATGAGI